MAEDVVGLVPLGPGVERRAGRAEGVDVFICIVHRGSVLLAPFIRKGDTVVLSGMSKLNTEFNNKTCVVKLIVQECSEKDYRMVFMVELEEQGLFPAIATANRRREIANKQTGYSRYGDQMQEHYFLARFSQITVQT